MFKSLNKKCLSLLLALFSVSTTSSLMAEENCCFPEYCCAPKSCNRIYIGAFGGQLFLNKIKFLQRGTAFFPEDVLGPLEIIASGRTRKTGSAGYGGAQIGYEWRKGCFSFSNWTIAPAVEFEALFYQCRHKAHLINPTVRLPEHDFACRFPTKVGMYLFSGVLSLNSPCMGRFSPYVGAGIGAANIDISKASSVQVSPPEFGVNHFDSDRSDTAWTFAAQVKAGVRFNFCERFHIFAEYRYLYTESSRFLLGSTIAPGHVPTSTWDIDMKSLNYNAYALGIQFDL